MSLTSPFVSLFALLMSILQIKDVSHTFSEKIVLKSLSFTMQQGEIVVLTGTSGTGKTTLLKIIGGLLQPTKGAAFYNGERIKGPREKLIPGHTDIKYVAQQVELMPMLSAAKNIDQGALHLMPEEQEASTNNLLTLLKIDDVRSQPLRTLSGGQQQRVALAKQLAGGGAVYLFDEVLSQLDLDTKAQIMLRLKEYLRREKKSAIFVLHDPLDTFYLADRVIVLEDGCIVQDDTPSNVYQKPATLSTAKLFGLVNVVSSDLARKLWPKKNFHQIENKVIIRPRDIKKSELPEEAILKTELVMPGYTLAVFRTGGEELIVTD